jgi:hypothetical protein
VSVCVRERDPKLRIDRRAWCTISSTCDVRLLRSAVTKNSQKSVPIIFPLHKVNKYLLLRIVAAIRHYREVGIVAAAEFVEVTWSLPFRLGRIPRARPLACRRLGLSPVLLVCPPTPPSSTRCGVLRGRRCWGRSGGGGGFIA